MEHALGLFNTTVTGSHVMYKHTPLGGSIVHKELCTPKECNLSSHT